MKHMLLFAGAAALGFAGPALAHPGGGHGNGHGHGYGVAHGHGYDAEDEGDDDEGVGQGIGYGVGGCPPGLAKKTPACIPPGLARQQGVVGQGLPMGYANPYGYGAVPYYPQPQYNPYYSPYATPYSSPYYGYGYGYQPYQADPRTMIVQQIVGALVR